MVENRAGNFFGSEINTGEIADLSVTTEKIADGAITSIKLSLGTGILYNRSYGISGTLTGTSTGDYTLTESGTSANISDNDDNTKHGFAQSTTNLQAFDGKMVYDLGAIYACALINSTFYVNNTSNRGSAVATLAYSEDNTTYNTISTRGGDGEYTDIKSTIAQKVRYIRLILTGNAQAGGNSTCTAYLKELEVIR